MDLNCFLHFVLHSEAVAFERRYYVLAVRLLFQILYYLLRLLQLLFQ